MTTKTLYVLRHAKAEVGTAEMHDSDRPLAEKGRKQAAAFGQWLRNQPNPPHILSSSSVRTRQTAENAGLDVADFLDDLYLASVSDACTLIRSQDDTIDSLMLLGHNPGLHELVAKLSGSWEQAAHEVVSIHFPTCACAVIRFDTDSWAKVDKGTGHLAEVWTA